MKQAAKAALDTFGVALASPRTVTGTLPLHAELERALSQFLGTEDTVVFASGYHAATGLFESLLSDRDYLFCDAQVQPCVADGIRLCRAKVFPYRSRDVNDLEDRLRRSRSARFRVIVTDGVFPLEGSHRAPGGHLHAGREVRGDGGGRGRPGHRRAGAERQGDTRSCLVWPTRSTW